MKAENFNKDWKFWEDRDSFALVWSVPENAKDVTLPHDAMMERIPHADSVNGTNTGFYDGGNYVYEKRFFVAEEQRNLHLVLAFGGVYMNALVYVNEQLAGRETNGYTEFFVSLDDYVKCGEENTVRVEVRNCTPKNSRWYPGSGIYRNVYILSSGKTYIPPRGVRTFTETLDGDRALVRVETRITNAEPVRRPLLLVTTVRDREGKTVGREVTRLCLFGGEEPSVTQRIRLSGIEAWSEENPALYAVETGIYDAAELEGKAFGGFRAAGGEEEPAEAQLPVLDTAETTLGIRTLTVDSENGLRVNGTSVKLRGACIHHDNGPIGAAEYYDAAYRKVKKLKEAGFNAIRMAHNPASEDLLTACDELGMYVMDEFSDMWTRLKGDFDYGMSFGDSWERDLTAMVQKDINHPSVILYSIGNEIPEIGTPVGAKVGAELSALVKSMDPTRPVTAGINGVFAAGDRMDEIMGDVMAAAAKAEAEKEAADTEGPANAAGHSGEDTDGKAAEGGNVNDFMGAMDAHMGEIVRHPAISERLEMADAFLDVVGYNYMESRYEDDRAAYPNRVIVGSETYPPAIAGNWKTILKCPNVIGDFTWTGWDYIGEAGLGIVGHTPTEGGFGAAWPAMLSYDGDIDITGFRRPMSYLREIVFGQTTETYIGVQDPAFHGAPVFKTPWPLSDAVSSWTWPGQEGKPVTVEVYTAGDEVVLSCNGKEVGRQAAGDEHRVLFETVYTPGELTAVSLKDGQILSEAALRTSTGPEKLVLSNEDSGQDLVFVSAEVTDGENNIFTPYSDSLTVSVTGGQLLGFTTGNPKYEEPFFTENSKTWNGRALAVIRRTEGQQVKVTVQSSDGLSAELTA